MKSQDPQREEHAIQRRRWRLLAEFIALTEKPLIVLSAIWLVLLIIDLTSGLSRLLLVLHYSIWGVFILDFLVRLAIAPNRLRFLQHQWLTAVSLLLPALRILRVVQAFRAVRLLRGARIARSANLVRVLGSVNRSMSATRRVLRKRGIGYVAVATIIVVFAGAAGMLHFESAQALQERGYSNAAEARVGFESYGDALWWTAMIITTMGSENWPKTTEGRILCWLLAVYAFAIFGYITATIASIFVGQDVKGRGF